MSQIIKKILVFSMIFATMLSCINPNNQKHQKEMDKITLNSKLLDEIQPTNNDDTILIDLKKIGAFDSIFFYGPYISRSDIEAYHGQLITEGFDYIDDQYCLIVLLKNDSLLSYSMVSRKYDFSLLTKKKYAYRDSMLILKGVKQDSNLLMLPIE